MVQKIITNTISSIHTYKRNSKFSAFNIYGDFNSTIRFTSESVKLNISEEAYTKFAEFQETKKDGAGVKSPKRNGETSKQNNEAYKYTPPNHQIWGTNLVHSISGSQTQSQIADRLKPLLKTISEILAKAMSNKTNNNELEELDRQYNEIHIVLKNASRPEATDSATMKNAKKLIGKIATISDGIHISLGAVAKNVETHKYKKMLNMCSSKISEFFKYSEEIMHMENNYANTKALFESGVFDKKI